MKDYTTRWLLVLIVAIAAAACGKPDSCPPPNYSPGDKFKITINSIRVGDTPCSEMPLGPGDSFVVTASIYTNLTPKFGECYGYRATPEVPEFAKGVMISCSPGGGQLGVLCEGVTNDGCKVSMDSQIGEVPSVSQGVIEHALFEFSIFGGQELDGGRPCSMGWECGLDQFDVRIERLAPGADGGG